MCNSKDEQQIKGANVQGKMDQQKNFLGLCMINVIHVNTQW